MLVCIFVILLWCVLLFLVYIVCSLSVSLSDLANKDVYNNIEIGYTMRQRLLDTQYDRLSQQQPSFFLRSVHCGAAYSLLHDFADPARFILRRLLTLLLHELLLFKSYHLYLSLNFAAFATSAPPQLLDPMTRQGSVIDMVVIGAVAGTICRLDEQNTE